MLETNCSDDGSVCALYALKPIVIITKNRHFGTLQELAFT
ncbi:hypothetical protein DICVIV_06769 [Dictyocaulus viviparus]|uniref:Uncharacterized protein n=1 Tax=Dictyocaulus viviparus TaxID=29172 RepID=A0A0D8XXW8_DICVI|nr:hypothetical protein DICVIV_06769 [Dictyocaulus viviparus]